MELAHSIKWAKVFQDRYPNVAICGSLALMCAGLLPERWVGDVDFVVSRSYFDEKLFKDLDMYEAYKAAENDNYDSYYIYTNNMKFNALVFDDDVELNYEEVKVGDTTLLCQKMDDILYWKEKYNRKKDIRDLEAIKTKAIEDAVFGDVMEDINERNETN